MDLRVIWWIIFTRGYLHIYRTNFTCVGLEKTYVYSILALWTIVWKKWILIIHAKFLACFGFSGTVILQKILKHAIHLFPLEREMNFNKLQSSSLRNTLCQIILILTQLCQRGSRKYENFMTTSTRKTDKFWVEKILWICGSGELKKNTGKVSSSIQHKLKHTTNWSLFYILHWIRHRVYISKHTASIQNGTS